VGAPGGILNENIIARSPISVTLFPDTRHGKRGIRVTEAPAAIDLLEWRLVLRAAEDLE
jgi:hypothetical protein